MSGDKTNDDLQLNTEISSRLDLKRIFPDRRFGCTGNIRRDVYIHLSNCDDVSEDCLKLLRIFCKYAEKTIIGRNCVNNDILDIWTNKEEVICLNKDKYEEKIEKITFLKKSDPLFSDLKLQCNFNNAKRVVPDAYAVKKIGPQHIRLFSKPEELSSSDTDDLSDDCDSDSNSHFKKRKTCQKAKCINLSGHGINCSLDPSVKCQVDILIFIRNAAVSKSLAQHFGFIFFEGVLEEEKDVPSRLMKAEAKLYKLAQTEISKRLINGCSNICITSNECAWNNIQATARAVIATNSEKDDCAYLMDDANYFVVIQDGRYAYIAAIGEILNESLSVNVVIPTKYELDENKFTTVNIPLAAIIPFYILRYFTQSYHKTLKKLTIQPQDIFSKT